ncbi:OapC/ArvC family zinc-ribbon domain-containing protein [Natrarchaeobius chitinivorans]|uniref:Origin-associated protein OapC n=1 Tax=Natrarchaeobius chitinivorans TaxID=1679083 RepID=A0A3N6P7X5_NATCH|nr:Zn-ribbon containing protein [Natrarchaeobius chitinivorans]RQG94629.1 hypothetical protein EA473_11135 [Natrarchaeobius chitinivorans]
MPHECTNCGRTFPDGSKEMLSGCPDCGGNRFQFTPATPSGADRSDSRSEIADKGGEPDRFDGSGSPDPSSETGTDWVSADQKANSEFDRPRTEPSSDRLEKSDVSDRAWPETARRPEDRAEAKRSRPETDPSPPSASEQDWTEANSNGTAGEESPTLAETEESAQADARSEVVPRDELPTASDRPPAERRQSDSDDDPEDGTEEPPDPDSEAAPENGRVVSEPTGDQPSIEDLRAELNEQFESIKILNPGQYELNLMELYNREEYIISLQEDGRYVIDVPDSWRDGDE